MKEVIVFIIWVLGIAIGISGVLLNSYILVFDRSLIINPWINLSSLILCAIFPIQQIIKLYQFWKSPDNK